jgi:hypothetical protein
MSVSRLRIEASGAGKTRSDVEAAIAASRKGTSSLGIGTARLLPPFVVERSCDERTMIVRVVRSTSRFRSAKSSPLRSPLKMAAANSATQACGRAAITATISWARR